MFSKKTAAEPRPVAASRSSGGSTFSVLGADTAIKGDLTASADLHIDGKVEGDITCSALVQGESSEVIGGITAETARLAGTIRGSIKARELVVLKTARIHGDVSYEALTIEQGASVDGRLSPRGAVSSDSASAESAEAHLILASSTE
ncbi:MAG: polymer-forming cytoskeletal protein [Novosphingobium sp.]|nr:polymer-forming cytoskeletal protein [Novosphingobium sp.]